jgi:hypothetical protein
MQNRCPVVVMLTRLVDKVLHCIEFKVIFVISRFCNDSDPWYPDKQSIRNFLEFYWIWQLLFQI